MFEIIALVISKGLIFALAGICVRVQLSLWRGFDVFLAVAVLLSAEVAAAVGNALLQTSILKALLAMLVAGVACATGVFLLWNFIIAGGLRRTHAPESALLILSLGTTMAATGLIGFIRGPGLVQSDVLRVGRVEWGAVGVGAPVLYTICTGLVGLGVVMFWLNSRSGFALELVSQNRQFAEELGITPRALILPTSMIAGFAAGIIGSSLVLLTGSTPEIGLHAFLYGATAALVLQAPSLTSAVKGGLLLGAIAVVLELVVAPALAEPLLFILVLFVLILRGSKRTRQKLR